MKEFIDVKNFHVKLDVVTGPVMKVEHFEDLSFFLRIP